MIRWVWAAPCFAAALGCAAAPLGDQPARRELHVVAEEPIVLELHAVEPTGTRLVAGPEKGASFDFTVWSGRYVVQAVIAGQRVRLAAPLVDGVVPAEGLTVRVTAPPPDEPDWAWIPEGPALIGDTLGVGQEDEHPAHLSQVGGFWLGRTEVTNADYARFLNEVGPIEDQWLAFDSLKCLVRKDPATGRFGTTAPRKPIVTVSKPGADAYCAWLTRTTGMKHRLPTEVEWEKAARGPETRVYAYGDTSCRAAANQESGELKDVALFEPNGFGLYDLTGNAFEWVADAYDAHAYQHPTPGSAPADKPYQVLRGGSFVLDGLYLRNSFRMRQRGSVRTDDFGFRVVREPARKA